MNTVRWNRFLAHWKKQLAEQGRDFRDDERLLVVSVTIAIAAGTVSVGARRAKQLIRRAIAKLSNGCPGDEVIPSLMDHLRA